MKLLKTTIDRFEGDKAVLITEDGQQFSLHKDSLPEGIKEGDSVNLHFSRDNEATEEKNNLAKNILQQILKKDE